MARNKTATLREVAARAEVSTATASHALNNTRPVGTEVRARVEAAADDLGYRPNIFARGLKTGSSRLVTCIVSSLSNPLVSAAVEGAHGVLHRHGYGMLVFRSGPDGQDVSEAAEFAASYHSAGLIVFHPLAEHSSRLQRWVKGRRPIVFAIHPHGTLKADQVLMADEEAAFTATKILLEQGHREIALLIRSLSLDVYASIVSGYRRALEEAGVSAADVLVRGTGLNARAGSAQELGYHETVELLELADAPSALLCAHNQIAVGALRALQDRGVKVPEHMSLISFDRVDWMDITVPRITSIGIDGRIVGETAAERLMERIEGCQEEISTKLLPLQVFDGESVALRRNR